MNCDQINGIFEILSALFVLNHCLVLKKDKQVKGINILSVVFFTGYGLFNIYYYPTLKQWISFCGALFIMVANFMYLYLLVKYKKN